MGKEEKVQAQAGRIVDTHGPAGVAALVDLLCDQRLGLASAHILAGALDKAGPAALDALRQAWPRLGSEARVAVLGHKLSEEFLPCFQEAAAADDPDLHVLGHIRLVDMGYLEYAEPLLDMAVSPRLTSFQRGWARISVLAAYHRHGVTPFPSAWEPESPHCQRLRLMIPTMGGGSSERWPPIDPQGHMTAVRKHLMDPEPALRLRAVELALPEMLEAGEWLRLFGDADAEVRRAAAGNAPADERLHEDLLALLAGDPDEEVRQIVSERPDLPADRVLARLTETIAAPGLGAGARWGLALRLCEMMDEGHPVANLETVIETTLASDDFRLRHAGYEFQRRLGREIAPSPLDAAFLAMMDLKKGNPAREDELAKEIVARGPGIVRGLMEAACFILPDSPAARVFGLVLRRLGFGLVAPELIAIAGGTDEDLACEVVMALSFYAPSTEAWEALMDLWQKESRPHVMYAMLEAAEPWPVWRAGAFYLRVIEGGCPLRRRMDAIEYAVKKKVPGLGRTAVRLLAADLAPDLTEDLYTALIEHLREAEDLDAAIARLNPEENEATRAVVLQALDGLERVLEEEGEEEEDNPRA